MDSRRRRRPHHSFINFGPTISNSTTNLLCCDRSHFRTDVCYMLGDIRTGGGGRSILLVSPSQNNKTEERIRPYTRKWEKGIMNTVGELALRPSLPAAAKICDVKHKAPAVVFSTAGYTGNVFHEFNDGLIPLYITAARFSGEVVLVVSEYHEWWFSKYEMILEKMSRYEIVDLRRDRRVHCFDEMIVGLKIHGDLAIDSNLMHEGKSIHDFQSLLTAALAPTAHKPSPEPPLSAARFKLTIIVRHHSRRLLNLQSILHLLHHSGFQTTLLSPKRSTPLSDIHRSLTAADALLSVHGAALTHLLFMRPGSVLIQIIPLGLDWAAETYYGEPARRLGLRYLAYNVTAGESSLSKEYGKDDPVLVNPNFVTKKGWAETKRVYMDKQDVDLDLQRFGKVVRRAKAILKDKLLRSHKNI
ncbi:protein O-linked-mannose beta-1,4-N-acetylglucosaminyltransferase 2-like [Phalaenopsis equestris]|uniref:protein O-linked-mannose beta-1,4-N-acetylglucosaminyltransferase 2-like n=1 Tax=Phalaenopsis equestris TaxID=78828 RepID=UPI0009E4FD62|nr:protein O-linked-mannose beta-1,4-N-acetylglucosaminyltransferase 2-like [Phalaenopsis equestris]